MVDKRKTEFILSAKDKTKAAASSIKKRLKGIESRVFSLQGAFASLGVSVGFGAIANDLLNVANSFEQMEVKLDALTKGRGLETLEEINAWALDMPVNTQKAVDTFVMMQAMGLDPTIDKMETLVDVSSVFGEEAMPRVARALGQMQTLGKLSAEELNQMAEAGINARKYLSEAFGGKTVKEIQNSQIAIEDITAAIMQGLDRDFGGAAKRAQESWQGLKATTASYIDEIERRVMDAGLFEELKTQISDVNVELKDWLETNDELIKQKVPEYISNVKDGIVGVATGAKSLYDTFNDMPDWVKTVGIVGALVGGKAGFGALVGFITFADAWHEYVASVKAQKEFLLDAQDKQTQPAPFVGEDIFRAGKRESPGADLTLTSSDEDQTFNVVMTRMFGTDDWGVIAEKQAEVNEQWRDAFGGMGFLGETADDEGSGLSDKELEGLEKRYGQLSDYLMTEEELVYENYFRRFETLQELRNQGLVSETQFADMYLDLESKKQNALAKIEAKGLTDRMKFERKTDAQKLKFTIGFMSQHLNAVTAGNKTMFDVQKAFKLAEAAMELPAGVSKTFNSYPYPWNIPMAAAHLAMGVMQIQQIASQSFGDSSASVPSVGPAPSVSVQTPIIDSINNEFDTGEEVQPSQTINIYIEGHIIDHDAFARETVPAIRKAIEDGV